MRKIKLSLLGVISVIALTLVGSVGNGLAQAVNNQPSTTPSTTNILPSTPSVLPGADTTENDIKDLGDVAKTGARLGTELRDKCNYSDSMTSAQNTRCREIYYRLINAPYSCDRGMLELFSKAFTSNKDLINQCISKAKTIKDNDENKKALSATDKSKIRDDAKKDAEDNCKDFKDSEKAACIAGYVANKAGDSKDVVCGSYNTSKDKEACEAGFSGGAKDTGDIEADCDTKWNNPLSWILCPVMHIGSSMSDFVFGNLVQPLLGGSPIDTASNDPYYEAWQSFRNIANILLIGVMLIIVLSQLTEGWGLNAVDAYTVKKVAPRLLIGVIAINISIYLCIAAIDITNIIGNGIRYLLEAPFANSEILQNAKVEANAESTVASGIAGGLIVGAGFAAVKLGVLAAAGELATVGFLFMIPLFITMIFAAIAVLFTLVFRFGLIVFLSLISPIAIACFILPGTEKYFKLWYNQFFKTLLVYPIIAIIFAMSNILGVIFVNNSTKINDSAGLASFIIGVFVVYAPMFLIPFSFKFAGGAIGTIGQLANKTGSKWAGQTNKKYGELKGKRGNVIGNAHHRAKENLDHSGLSSGAIGAGLGGALARRRGARGIKSNLGAIRQGYSDAIASRQGTHSFDTAQEYMKSHNFQAFGNDDDRLWAGIRGNSISEIEQALIARAPERFRAGDNATRIAAQDIYRAKQEAGSEVFETAAALGLSTSGTGLDYGGEGDNMYDLINHVAGDNRGLAARMLGTMRENAVRTGRSDLGSGSYTNSIVNMEKAFHGQMSGEDAFAAHVQDMVDSQGGSLGSMKHKAFKLNAMPALRKNLEQVLSGQTMVEGRDGVMTWEAVQGDEAQQRRAIQEFASLAGKHEALSQTNPKVAREMADGLFNMQFDTSSSSPAIQQLVQNLGFTDPNTPPSYAQVMEALRGNADFQQMRREYATATAAGAASSQAAIAGALQPPQQQPPANPGG